MLTYGRRPHVNLWLVAVTALLAALVSALPVGGARSASRASGLIAFTRYDGIYVMREDGSGVRAIRRGGVVSLAWSPDGRKLAFTNGRDIWVMDADGTDPVRVAANEDPTHGVVMSPTWSPDGKRIAYTASSEADRDIWVVNADGSNRRRLARTPRVWEYELDWNPAGRIAFTNIVGMFSRLYVMNANGSNVRILTPGYAFEASTPDWSPNGRRIAFVHRLGSTPIPDAEIWIMDTRSRSRVRLTTAETDNDPNWSPDGREIAFVRGGGTWADSIGFPPRKRSSSEIYVMNADGTGVTRLTHNRVGEGSPAWQPVAPS